MLSRIQYAFLGHIEITKSKLKNPSIILLKPIGFYIVVNIMIFVIIIGSTIVVLSKIKMIGNFFKRAEKYLKRIFEKYEDKLEDRLGDHLDRIAKWVYSKFTYEHRMTFHDEYIYYKYYLNGAKADLKSRRINYLPNGLEEIAQKSHKDYLTATLSGLKYK